MIMRSSAKIVCEDAVWWPDLGYERATKRLRLTWEGGNGEIVTIFELTSELAVRRKSSTEAS